MIKQTVEIILDDDIREFTLKALVDMINLSQYKLPFPDGYGKIKAKPVFNCKNVTVVIKKDEIYKFE